MSRLLQSVSEGRLFSLKEEVEKAWRVRDESEAVRKVRGIARGIEKGEAERGKYI